MSQLTKKFTTDRARRQGPQRREAILDAATEMFSRAGFHHASIADIAAAVGITQAGLLHHFPSKRELLLAVLQEREDRNATSEMRRYDAGADYLQSFVQTLRENEKTPAMVQLFAILSSEAVFADHPAHAYFVDRYRRLIRTVTEALEPVVDVDRLPSGATTETVARWIVAAADGLRLQWLLDPDAVDRPASLEQLIEILRPYLRDGSVVGSQPRTLTPWARKS